MSVREERFHDHQVLRAKLTLLEEWLPFTRAAPRAVRNILATLARPLRSHAGKEEWLLEPLTPPRDRPRQLAARLPSEYQDPQQTVTILLELLATGRECPVEQVETHAAHLIDSLREPMADEEAGLFPVVDQAGRGNDEPIPPMAHSRPL